MDCSTVGRNAVLNEGAAAAARRHTSGIISIHSEYDVNAALFFFIPSLFSSLGLSLFLCVYMLKLLLGRLPSRVGRFLITWLHFIEQTEGYRGRMFPLLGHAASVSITRVIGQLTWGMIKRCPFREWKRGCLLGPGLATGAFRRCCWRQDWCCCGHEWTILLVVCYRGRGRVRRKKNLFHSTVMMH